MTEVNKNSLIAAGVLMGIGLGGFIDGIIFHQIFQLHSMLSAKLRQDILVNVKISMVWDGLFHLLTWLSTAGAVYLSWNIAPDKNRAGAGKTYIGAILAGWGIFNLIEGLIDHYVLQIHHVVERLGLSVYDHLFLAFGVFLLITGRFVIKKYNQPAILHNQTTNFSRGSKLKIE